MHRIHVIDNFISAEDAAVLIQEQRNPSEINPYPEYYKDRYGGTAFPYNDRVMNILKFYGEKANNVHKELNGFVNPIYVFKAFGSWWQEGTKGGLHLDAQDPEPFIEWSTVIYLNEQPEYEGGAIFFPNQEYVYQPKRYSAVFFPSAGSEYIHGITTVTKGNRHTALYMHTSMPRFADPDFLGEDKNPRWEAQHHELTRA